MTSKADVYSCEHIQVLSSMEAIRRRPAMYVGDVRDGSGLHHLLWEVVGNSIDEHLEGHTKKVRVSIEGRLAEVEDDGRGIPVEEYRSTGRSVLETVLTCVHAGPTFDGHPRHVHVGLHGVGLVCVNALSEWLEVEVRRDSWTWRQRYVRGEPVTPLERVERTTRTGTRLRFEVDRSIFGGMGFDRRRVRDELVGLAPFNPALTFDLMSERIAEPRGLAASVEALATADGVDDVEDVFMVREERGGVVVEVALGWSATGISHVQSFVGQRPTPEGGTHVRGFWNGLARAVARQDTRASRPRVRGPRAYARIAPGLFGIVHVGLWSPAFGGPTRDRLVSPEVATIVRAVMADRYAAHLAERPALACRLLARLAG